MENQKRQPTCDEEYDPDNPPWDPAALYKEMERNADQGRDEQGRSGLGGERDV